MGGAAAGERSEWRVLVSQTRVVLLLGYARVVLVHARVVPEQSRSRCFTTGRS